MNTFTKAQTTTGNHQPKKKSRIHTAVIFSPAEVEFNFRNFTDEARARIRGRWMLAGAVNDELYKSLEDNEGADVAAELVILPAPSGAAYTVLTCQLGEMQHRFVLPMYEHRVVELLTTATKEPLSIYLESTGAVTKGIAYDCPLKPKRFEKTLSQFHAIDAGQKIDFIIEFPAVVTAFSSLDAVPSLNGGCVRDVDASFFLPMLNLSNMSSVNEMTRAAIYKASRV